MAKKRRKQKPKKTHVFLRLMVGAALIAGFGLLLFIFFNPWVWRLDLKKELEKSKLATTVYDRGNQPVVNLYAKNRLWVSSENIPETLKNAFIATEDNRFMKHKGIDVRGILRALYQDVKAGKKVQGGSTITQQLVKNVFLTHQKRFTRKIWEMAYALRIEQQYSKEKILEFYLNSIYLGHGSWGVDAASQVYFGKSVSELTTAECAMIAGLAKSPEFYSPYRHPEAALKRRNLVLKLMRQHGYLTKADYQAALQEPLETLEKPGTAYTGAYFVDYILETLKEELSLTDDELRSGGYKIYTTMDRRVQQAAEGAFVELAEAGPDRYGVMQPQGALVAMDPHSGEILAVVGGRRYSSAQTNRSFQIYRQPGSAVKPFVFAAALENGYTPQTRLEDKPLEIWVNDQVWRPQNYDNQYRGWVTLQEALEESINTIAIQLVQQLGVSTVFEMAERMGLKSLVREGTKNDMGLAPLALGGLTRGVTLLELTASYGAFANDGVYHRPYGVQRVYDAKGRLVYQNKPEQKEVLRPEIARTLTAMMAGVIERGTGIRAKPVINAAGKTGTSNRNTNGWFIGYNSNILAGVWIGNDQASEPLVANGISLGSGTAAAIWGEFLRKSGRDEAEFQSNSTGR